MVQHRVKRSGGFDEMGIECPSVPEFVDEDPEPYYREGTRGDVVIRLGILVFLLLWPSSSSSPSLSAG